MRPRAARVIALVAVVILAAAVPASAQLYQWTDADGVRHYTNSVDSVPAARRHTVRELATPSPRADIAGPADHGTAIAFTAGAPIVVGAHLNGVSLRLLVDTGASRTLIAPAALARAGFSPEGGRPVRISGVTGSSTATEVAVPLLEIGQARVGPLTVIAHALGAPDNRTPSAAPPPDGVDGLLGRDVLQFFTLAVDAAAGRAILTPR